MAVAGISTERPLGMLRLDSVCFYVRCTFPGLELCLFSACTNGCRHKKCLPSPHSLQIFLFGNKDCETVTVTDSAKRNLCIHSQARD